MKKPIRLSLIVLSVFAGILIILAIFLTLVFDPNNYRDSITYQIEQKTGRTLTLGDIELSFFPWLGVQLNDVQLSNAAGFKPAQMMLLKKLNLHIKLLPLFTGEVQVGDVTLDTLTVSLARNKKGITNWDDLQRKLQNALSTTPQIEDSNYKSDILPVKSEETSNRPNFAIEGIHILNANLSWHDALKHKAYEIKNLNLKLDQLLKQKFVPLDASFNFNADHPKASVAVTLTAALDVNLITKSCRLRDLELHENIKSKVIPGGEIEITTHAKAINLYVSKQLLEVTDLETRAFNTRVNASARITSLFNQPKYEASIELAPFSPRKLARTLKVNLPPSADTRVLESLSLKIKIKGNTRSLQIKPLELKLDETTVLGQLALQFKKQPRVTFKLDTDQLDVDRYLPAEKKQNNKSTTKVKTISTKHAESRTTTRPASPAHALAGLTKFDMDGILHIQKLKVNRIRLQKVRIPVKNHTGKLTLAPVKADLYSGTSYSEFTILANLAQPRFKLKQQLNHVKLAPLLNDLMGEAKASGVTNASLNLTTQGMSAELIKAHLKGNAKFNLKDGEIKGINIPEMKRKIDTALKGNAAPKKNTGTTAFSDARGSAVIKDGIIYNKDLRATLSYARIAGLGQVSLPANTIDYTLLIKFTSEATAQSGTPYDQMNKVALPVHIRGALNHPSIKPDYDAVLKGLLNRELKNQEKRLQKKLEDEVSKKLSNELEKLFKR